MGRGSKIAIGVLVAVAVLIGVNALVTGAETKPAETTVPGGRIVALPGGDLQVVDRGPRDAPPIVLVHCFTCSIEWWDGMVPRLARSHRVVAVDLLGHGGSEKPESGYAIESQADLVARALSRLGVRDAMVVGHSLGGPVSVALAEQSPGLVDRLVVIDTVPDSSYGDVGFIAELPFRPVIGETLWRIKPDFAISDGLEVAFAPGFPVPDAFVEGVKRMTYSAYEGSHEAFDEYTGERSMPDRAAELRKPVLSIMGAEEQLADDPRASLAAYDAAGPLIQTRLIRGAGHSPNVEKPALTSALVLKFDVPSAEEPGSARHGMQKPLQKQSAVRRAP